MGAGVSTVTGGIQDISALLPLLGTEQCENHVGSALEGGYLYAAAAPLSLFGSLGVARMGLKVLLASVRVSIGAWERMGAQVLKDAGFEVTGDVSSQIMFAEGRHVAESRLLSLLEDLHIENPERVQVESRNFKWNLQLVIASAAFAFLGITPYIPLNVHYANSVEDPVVHWMLPILRVLGGFLVTTTVQFIIQFKMIAILRYRLIFMALDPLINESRRVEGQSKQKAVAEETLPDSILWDPKHPSEVCLKSLERYLVATRYPTLMNKYTSEMKKHNPSEHAFMQFLCQFFLGLGGLLSIVGYIGSFTIVQGSSAADSIAPGLIWLGLEGLLSLLRLILWGWNPENDEPSPIQLRLELDLYAPLPTCYEYVHRLEEGTIPLVRERPFLEQVTSYCGPITRFEDKSVSLFYTLTRSKAVEGVSTERTLYVTIIDYTENSSRTYIPHSTGDSLLYAVSPVPNGNKGISEVTIVGAMSSASDDYLLGNKSFKKRLDSHCKSILDSLKERDSMVIDRIDHTHHEIKWTLEASDIYKLKDVKVTVEKRAGGRWFTKWIFCNHRSSVLDPKQLEEGTPYRGASKTNSLKLQNEDSGRPWHPPHSSPFGDNKCMASGDDWWYLLHGEKQCLKRDHCRTRATSVEALLADVRQSEWSNRKARSDTNHTLNVQEMVARGQLLIQERECLERILIKESLKLEAILRKEHRRMAEKIFNGKDERKMQRRLRERLQEESICSSQIRLRQEMEHAKSRLAAEKGRFASDVSEKDILEPCDRMEQRILRTWEWAIEDVAQPEFQSRYIDMEIEQEMTNGGKIDIIPGPSSNQLNRLLTVMLKKSQQRIKSELADVNDRLRRGRIEAACITRNDWE